MDKRRGGGPVELHLTRGDGVPIYLQIVRQIKYLVASGRLIAGAELPPIRTLADQLIVNPNTVARAYRELAAAGLLANRGTAGTYVCDAGSPLARRERRRLVIERIDALLAEARQLDVPFDEVLGLLRQRQSELSSPSRKAQP